MIENFRAQDLAALRRLSDAYALAMDNCDLDAFPHLFVPEGALVVKRPGRDKPMGAFQGPGPDGVGLIALLMKEHYRATMHHITTHDAQVTGDDATGTTLCLAYHIHDGDVTKLETLGVRYDETYVRTPEGWRFRVREATRQWSQITEIPYEPLVVDRAAAASVRTQA